FSSRRRQTRFSRDWSSDVCSSDLIAGTDGVTVNEEVRINYFPPRAEAPLTLPVYPPEALAAGTGEYVVFVTVTIDASGNVTDVRSEERRVGKAGRSRRQPASQCER